MTKMPINIRMTQINTGFKYQLVNPKGKWIKDNPFFEPLNSTVEQTFLEQTVFKDQIIEKPYVSVTGTYNEPEQIRTFDYFGHMSTSITEQIRNNNLHLVFNMASEGSHKVFPFAYGLHNNALKHGIPLKNIHYICGDLREEEFYKAETGGGINIYSVIVFAAEQARWAKVNKYTPKRNIEIENHSDKYFTCLSRKARYWRSFFIKDVLQSDISEKAIISHGTFTTDDEQLIYDIPHEYDYVDNPVVVFWKERGYELQPGTHYKKDVPLAALEDLYSQVLFDVSLETWQDEDVEFYTEKTIKPMMMGMPVLIWGASGINKNLKKYGFKTYESWFDLSFDDEPDTIKRKDLLLQEVRRVCNMLDNMSRAERLQWSQKNKSVLRYNQQILPNVSITSREINKLLNNINS